MMKIGFLIGDLGGGGAENVVLRLVGAMEQRGHRVYLIVINANCDYDTDHLKNIIFITHQSDASAKKTALRNKLDELQADQPFDLFFPFLHYAHKIICGIEPPNTYNSIRNTLSAQFSNKSAISTWLGKRRYRKLYNNRKLLVPSNGVKQDLIEEMKINARCIEVINNPYDFDYINARGNEPLGVDIPKPYLIHIGSFTAQKRHDLLLDAFSRQDEKYHLVLLGKGPLEASIREQIYSLGLEDRVHLVGWQSNPYNWIKNAILSILSSDYEGFPNVVVESLVLGVPVVSTNCPHGPAEILKGELACYLVPPGDSGELARVIKETLESPPSLRHEVVEEYGIARITDIYLSLGCKELSNIN